MLLEQLISMGRTRGDPLLGPQRYSDGGNDLHISGKSRREAPRQLISSVCSYLPLGCMLLCSRLELLPNVLGKDIRCRGGGSRAENTSRTQTKEDGVQPNLFGGHQRHTSFTERK